MDSGADGTIEYLNHQGIEYTGFSPEAYDGWACAWLLHPEDADRAQRAWEEASRTEAAFDAECRIRRFDGQFRWHAFRALPITDEGGALVRWIGTATDVEDAKQAETDLELAHRATADTLSLLETLHSKAPIGFGFVDRDFRVVRLNETLAAMNGSTVAQQAGRTSGRNCSRSLATARAAVPPGPRQRRSRTRRRGRRSGWRRAGPDSSLVDQLLPGRGRR